MLDVTRTLRRYFFCDQRLFVESASSQIPPFSTSVSSDFFVGIDTVARRRFTSQIPAV